MARLLTDLFFWCSFLGIVGTLTVLVGHLLFFGSPHRDAPKEPKSIRRMSLAERGIHACLMLGFLSLAVTGFASVLFFKTPITGWIRSLHVLMAPCFVLGLAASALRWSQTCCFQEYDWEWVRRFGGYLEGHPEVPAGRFNAGQKVYFWTILPLGILATLSGLSRAFPMFHENVQLWILQIHRYTCLLLLLLVISHIYLGTLANPGTIQVIFTGRVHATWAKQHHPLWWESLHEKETSMQEDRSHRT